MHRGISESPVIGFRPMQPFSKPSVATHKSMRSLWIYAVAVGARESRKTTQSAVERRGVSYILKVCVQLYEQEGSLCVCVVVFFRIATLPIAVGSESGSGYWCLFTLNTLKSNSRDLLPLFN